jgi:hypothetical protein
MSPTSYILAALSYVFLQKHISKIIDRKMLVKLTAGKMKTKRGQFHQTFEKLFGLVSLSKCIWRK